MTTQFKIMKKATGTNDKIDFLREITAALLDEVKALKPLKTVDIKRGINFNEEVTRFEIYLIERALEQTGGHQMRAARLLNLKYTTFHEKLKRFQISLRPGEMNGRETKGA
jgi:transcriptional regulator with GAF, ATPase, and Fis domain